MNIAKVSADFTANTSGFTAGMSKAGASVQRLDSVVSSSAGSFIKMGAALEVGQRAIGFVISETLALKNAMVGLFRSNAAEMLELGKLSTITGLMTEELVGYSEAAEDAGISQDTLLGAFKKFTKMIGDAKLGGKELPEIMGKLGMSFEDFRKLTPNEMLMVFSDRLKSIHDPSERAALACKLFGKTGMELIPILGQGSEVLRKYADDAKRVGLSFSSGDVGILKSLRLEWLELGDIVTVFARRMIVEFSPVILGVMRSLREVLDTVDFKTWTENMADAIKSTLPAFAWFASHSLKVLIQWSSGVALILAGVIDAFATLAVAIKVNVREVFGSLGPVGKLYALSAWELDKVPDLRPAIRGALGVADGLRQAAYSAIKINEAIDPEKWAEGMEKFTKQTSGGGGAGTNKTWGDLWGNVKSKLFPKGAGNMDTALVAAFDKAREQVQKEAADLERQVRTPQEIFQEAADKLQRFYETGYIGLDTYTRQMAKAQDDLAKTQAANPIGDFLSDIAERTQKAADKLRDEVKAPTEIFQERAQMIENFYRSGLISEETYIRQMQRAHEDAAKDDPFSKEMEDWQKRLEDVNKNLGEGRVGQYFRQVNRGPGVYERGAGGVLLPKGTEARMRQEMHSNQLDITNALLRVLVNKKGAAYAV